MADLKISALTASTTPLAGTEVLPIVQSSTTKKVSVADLTAGRAVSALSFSYTSTLTGGTGIINIGSGQIYKDASGNIGVNNTAPTSTMSVYNSVSGYKADFTQLSTGVGDYTGIAFCVTTSPSSGFKKGAVLFERTGSGAVGKLHWCVNTAADVTNVSLTDARITTDSAGNTGIGTTSPAATAILDIQSTTKGVRFPNMTTTQKNAITPSAGTMIFDTTLAKLCVYSGAAWQTITSV